MKKMLVFGKNDCPTCVELTAIMNNINLEFDIIYNDINNKEIFQKYCICSVPTTILLQDEVEIDRFYGVKDMQYIKNFFEEE